MRRAAQESLKALGMERHQALIVLAAFAALGQAMLVVIEGRAYEIRPRARSHRPVLLQNAPNPFNRSTVISFHVPVALGGEEARLTIYNLTGQRVCAYWPPTRARPARLVVELGPVGS